MERFTLKVSDRGFLAFLIAGAIVRIVLAIATSNSYDLWFFGSVAVAAQAHRHLYADTTFSYPPLWGYAFEDAGKLLGLLHVPVLVRLTDLAPYAIPGLTKIDFTTPLASLLLKLPAILVDAALAALLYRAAMRLSGAIAVARTVALGVWLNPLALITAPVQANWDAIVPLTMLAAVVYALEERWFWAGAIAAIGVWAKLTPLFFAFLVPALVYVPSLRSARTIALRFGGILFGACAASAVILTPVLVHGEFSSMLGAVFTRTGTFAIGGANLLAFAQLNGAVAVRDWIAAHRVPYGRFVLLLVLCGCALPTAVLLRRTVRDFSAYCAAVIAILAAICIASPFVQPTYVIWIVPVTTFLAATTDRRWWWPTTVLTFWGFIFFGSVRAPQALAEPACIFFHACDASAFGAQSLRYSLTPGFHSNTIQVTLNVFAGEILGFAMVATYAFAIRTLAANATDVREARPIATMPKRRSREIWALGLGLVALCACTLSPIPLAPRLDVRGSGNRDVISAIGFSGNVFACAMSASAPRISEIVGYFDPRYPNLRGVTATFAQGFAPHFIDALKRKHIDVRFTAVNADQLRVLLAEPPRSRALFVLGGVLPVTVRSRGYDPLRSWVRAGGTIFWAGGPFDLIWAHEHAVNEVSAYGGPDPDAWPALYSTQRDTIFTRAQNIFAPPVTFGKRRDLRWRIPGFDFDRTTLPLNSGPLLHAGGRILGSIDAHFNSSVSSIPIGNGTVVFFADAFDDEIDAADSLSQLLLCDTWSPRGRAAYFDGYLPDGGPPMTITTPRDTARLNVFAQIDGLGPYATYRP